MKEANTMAKTKKEETVVVVTIADLAAEYELEGKEVRAVARKIGLKATPCEQDGFGPKSKYQWDADSEELADLRKAIEEKLA